jgi:arginyl-tRNA synthetase
VLRALAQRFPNDDGMAATESDLKGLAGAEHLNVIKLLADWPRQLKEATWARQPHRITQYLEHLAQEFHSLWQKGNTDPTLRFVQEEPPMAKAYGALVQAVAYVIQSGLNVLGIQAKQELR